MNFLIRFFKKGEINRLLKEGNSLLEQKEYESSLALYNKVLTYDNKNLCALYGSAKCYYYIKDYNKAQTLFLEVEKNPQNTFFESYYYLYQIEINLGKEESAIYYLTKYIDKGKNKALAYKLRAELNFKKQKYYDVIDDCEKSLSILPDDLDVFKLMIKSRIYTEQLKKALIDVNKALENKGNSPDLLTIRSYLRYLNRNYSDALNDVKLAISLNNVYSEAYYTLALIQKKVNQQSEALNNLTTSIELNDSYPEAYIERAELYAELDKPDEALEDYKQVLKYYPNNPIYHCKCGSMQLKLYDFGAAKEHFEKAIELDPTNVNYYYNLSKALNGLKKYKEQLKVLLKALEINPQHEDCLLDLGILYYSGKEYQNALKTLDKLISINSENRRGYYYRAKVKEQLADNYGANSDYTIALLDQTFVDAWVDRAKLKISRQDYHGGVLDLSKAIALRPMNGTFYLMRGKAQVKLEKLAEALDDFTKAIEILPANVEAYYFRGFINYDLRRFKEALNDWQKAISLKPELIDKLSDKIEKTKLKIGV